MRTRSWRKRCGRFRMWLTHGSRDEPELNSVDRRLRRVLISLSYIPQVKKAWPRGSTHDLSLNMLAVLTAGLLLWIGYSLLKIGYSLLKGDWVIIAANGIGAALSASVFAFKIRDVASGS